METRKLKLALSAGALALSMALAGCGGGGGSAGGPPNEPGGMTLEEKQAAQRRAINTAISTAREDTGTALEDRDMASVNAAEKAINAAKAEIGKATDLPAAERAAFNTTIVTLESGVSGVRGELAKAAGKTMTDKAKALRTAIMAGNSATVTVTTSSIAPFDPDGDGDLGDTEQISLKKDGAVAMLGMWNGMNYAGEADDKTTGMVRAYSNAEEDKIENAAFDSRAGEAIHGLQPTSDSNDAPNVYAIVTGANMNIDGFPALGVQTYDEDDEVMGKFMKAEGTYKCTENGGCTSSPGTGGIDLSAGWTFTPSVGAMVEKRTPDPAYLQFGWWVRKNADGGPTHAGAFTANPGLTAVQATAINLLTGEATYSGSAAGKFAVSDPLNADGDNAGHFTADAKLTAKFSTASMLSGTIDGFRLNDGSEDPGWSVELKESGLASDAFGGATAQTEWSIGGNKGGATGQWQAEMFEDAGDKNTTPDSVTGTFRSTIGATHSLVGAFGASQ